MREEIIDFEFVFTRFVIIEKFQDNKSHLTPDFGRDGKVHYSQYRGFGKIFINPGIYTREKDESKVLECA